MAVTKKLSFFTAIVSAKYPPVALLQVVNGLANSGFHLEAELFTAHCDEFSHLLCKLLSCLGTTNLATEPKYRAEKAQEFSGLYEPISAVVTH